MKRRTKVQIKIAPVPLSPIPKSTATPSLLSQIITSKYQYSLPLYRQKRSLHLLNQFKTWLDKSALQVLPKSAIGKAIQYSLNQWGKLIGYIKNGDINIDNNPAERAVKPFVIGRKIECSAIPIAVLMPVQYFTIPSKPLRLVDSHRSTI